MVNIRKITKDDVPMLKSWWAGQGLPEPTDAMIPVESTYILEIDDKAVLSVALVETNMQYMALVENYVSNPEAQLGEAVGAFLLEFLRIRAKLLGYQNLVCLSLTPQLTKRYQAMGFVSMAKNLEFLKLEVA